MIPVTRPGAPAMDTSHAARWSAARVPWWVPRLVLVVAWLAAIMVGALSASDCTPLDPSVCGPTVSFTIAVVFLLATPILLWWLPAAGCAAGVVFSVLDLLYDPVHAANVAFAIVGPLHLAVAAWLIISRHRQRAIVAEIAGTVRLDPVLAERLRDTFPRWGWRTVVAALLIAGGAGCVVGYDHAAGQVTAHETAAVRMNARVQSYDSDNWVVVVAAPHPVRLDVVGTYRAGQTVPVLVDGSWVRLVAEPQDPTPWMSGALGAFLLAALLLYREQRMRSARRRLLSGPLPAVELLAAPDDQGRAVLQDDIAVVPVAAIPTAAKDGPWQDGWVAGSGQAWRGPARKPQTVTVAGDLREDGWVLLITDTEILLPEGPVRLRRTLDFLPGEPLQLTDPDDLPELPVVLRPRLRARALGAVALLSLAAAPAAVATGLVEGWWETLGLLWTGALLTHEGWSRLTARVTLTRYALEIRGRLRVHWVPWQRFHGVRRKGKQTWLAWEPDTVVKVNFVTDRWGAAMMRLREESLATRDPGSQATARPGIGLTVWLLYALAAAAALWWRYR